MDEQIFFREATRLCCSSLRLEESGRNFFHFLARHLPLKKLCLSGGFAQNDFNFGINLAIISEDQAEFPFSTVPVPNEVETVGRELGFFEPSNFNTFQITRADHPLLLYLKMFDEFGARLEAPLFAMRLVRNRQVVGTAIFCGKRSFRDDEIRLMTELELPLCITINNALQYHKVAKLENQIRQENQRLKQRLAGLSSVDVIGKQGGLRIVMEKVNLVAPLDVTVLIVGETGSGKELIARSIHELSARRKQRFVAVNCGAIAPTLVASELFGHAKGAFTGATELHKGKFEQANGGTLFLDEIGELPMESQTLLLRVLETREVERVGGDRSFPVNIRLVTATHRNLARMVKEGTFRQDLYYRLNVASIDIPPLRKRKHDIPLLVEHFLNNSANRYNMLVPPVPQKEMGRLLEYDWPGNVRELQNVLEESLVYSNGRPLQFRLEDAGDFDSKKDVWEPLSLDDTLREYFTSLLKLTRGRVSGKNGAALLAGMNAGTFRFHCIKLGINPRSFS